jgi:quinol monooxygenase YgiN
MIHTTVRMALPFERLSEALGILGPLAERIRVEPGCLSCHLYQDVQDEHILMFEGIWRSGADMERHLGSHEYRDMLLVMEMALEPPEVRFDTVSGSTGFETIHRARG